jgi:hypothetical protein
VPLVDEEKQLVMKMLLDDMDTMVMKMLLDDMERCFQLLAFEAIQFLDLPKANEKNDKKL